MDTDRHQTLTMEQGYPTTSAADQRPERARDMAIILCDSRRGLIQEDGNVDERRTTGANLPVVSFLNGFLD